MSDLISRAVALEALKRMPVEDTDAGTVQRCIEVVSNLPSAQPKRHKWIPHNEKCRMEMRKSEIGYGLERKEE